MPDLSAFRQAVRSARRSVGQTQHQLARAMGLHRDVLSHKINAHGSWVLTSKEVLAIVRVLAAWGAVATRADAEAMMRMMAVPEHIIAAQAWDAVPLANLTTDERREVGRSAAANDRGGAVRPTPPPRMITSLVGRADEILEAADILEHARLVTLTGAGGTGKTRLALEVAEAIGSRFPDGVAFADLAPVADPRLIDIALLRSLGLAPRSAGGVEDQLTEALRDAHLLLVTDNFEHLVEGSGVLGRLLATSPGLHVLATSRIRLRLYGEHQFRVPPLASKAEHRKDADHSESVQLFIERARAVLHGFTPRGDDLRLVAEICSRLGGLPLAIELAAAKVRRWPPRAMLDRLDERLLFIEEGPRDRPGRHQSLRAALEWSESLLTDADRQVFVHLGVFSGSFDAAAAGAVLGQAPDRVSDRLDELVEQSLVEESGDLTEAGSARFRMLEPVREYAVARLGETTDLVTVRRAHLHHYVSTTRPDPTGLATYDESYLDRLDADQANIGNALHFAYRLADVDDDCLVLGIQLASAVARLWHLRSCVPESGVHLERLLEVDARRRVVPVRDRAVALLRATVVACSHGDYVRTLTLAREALRLSTDVGDFMLMSRAHCLIGETFLALDDPQTAVVQFAQQADLARRAGSLVGEASAYNMLGTAACRQGRFDEAAGYLHRSVDAARALGDDHMLGSVEESLGTLAYGTGEIDLAAERFAASLQTQWGAGDKRCTAYALEGFAKVAAAQRRHAAAVMFEAAAQRLRDAEGWVLPPPDRAAVDRALEPATAALTPFERQRAEAAGRHRPVADIVEEALAAKVESMTG